MSDSEDAPESISLSLSKKAVTEKQSALLKARAQDKLKEKEKNREKDRRLKERKRKDDGDDIENPDHLPDHVFAAAFSQNPSPPKAPATISQPKQKKAKSRTRSAKDTVVGSRTIRTLPDPSRHASQLPSKKVERFISRVLNVKGIKSKGHTRGWERKPVNLGVMKSPGPAPKFVRDV